MREVCRVLNLSEVKAMFTYDPVGGVLRWKETRGFRKAGTIAGGFVNGTMYVTVDGERFKAADIAWTISRGKKPKKRLRYLDGDRSNIRIDNLAESDRKRPRDPDERVDVGLVVTPIGYKVVKFGKDSPVVLGVFPDYWKACECMRGALSVQRQNR